MDIAAEGIRDAHIPISGISGDTEVYASIDRETWVAVTVDENNDAIFLLAGPSAQNAPSGTPVVPNTGALIWVKIVKPPEELILPAGIVNVY
jgi:hypothetical protein